MKSYNVVKTETTKRGVIVHEVDSGDGELKSYHYAAIRGGLSWGSGESPAFFMILGEEFVDKTRFEGQVPPRGKLKVFTERQIPSPFLDKLFSALTDDCALFGCGYVYADLSDEHEESGKLFMEYVSEKKARYVSLEDAPFVNNFPLGVSLINRWLSEALLDLPKESLVRDQLKKLTKQDFGDSPEQRFFAVNALRFVLGSFYKCPPTSRVITITRKIKPMRSIGGRPLHQR